MQFLHHHHPPITPCKNQSPHWLESYHCFHKAYCYIRLQGTKNIVCLQLSNNPAEWKLYILQILCLQLSSSDTGSVYMLSWSYEVRQIFCSLTNQRWELFCISTKIIPQNSDNACSSESRQANHSSTWAPTLYWMSS